MEEEEYVRLFELEDKLWWFLGMRQISITLFDRYVPATESDRLILDVGCGTGGMLGTLRLFGKAFGADVSPRALRLARTRESAPLVQADTCRLPFASGSLDVVTSFDVIYHLGVSSDDFALLEIARVLRPDGVLLLRVPAMNLFRGRHDIAVHTRHRYGRREIEEKLIRAGFAPVFVSYLNCFLLPLAAFRRIADGILRPSRRGSEVEPVAPWLNRALYSFLLLEAKWIRSRSLPVGLSLIAVSRKLPTTAGPHANAISAHLPGTAL